MSQSPSRSSGPNRALRLGIGVVDRTTDALTVIALVAMVLVISWQVFARFILGFTPGWASEVALLLLVWLGLLATAKGVRDHSHIAVGLIVDRMPAGLRFVVVRLASLLMAVFGVYLVVKGGEFTYLMTDSTLPGTGLPTAVQYGALPVAGALILVYSALQLFGVLPAEAPAVEDTGPDGPDTQEPAGQNTEAQNTEAQDSVAENTVAENTAAQDTAAQKPASHDKAWQDTTAQDTETEDAAARDVEPGDAATERGISERPSTSDNHDAQEGDHR